MVVLLCVQGRTIRVNEAQPPGSGGGGGGFRRGGGGGGYGGGVYPCLRGREVSSLIPLQGSHQRASDARSYCLHALHGSGHLVVLCTTFLATALHV